MPRTVELNVPSGKSERLIEGLTELEDVLSVRLQKAAFVQPPGDLVVVSVLDRAWPRLARYLLVEGIGETAGSITTSVPLTMIDGSRQRHLARDTSEAGWEEIEALIGRESNMTPNTILVMGIAGVLATTGLVTNALHLVIAGMLIAPGFEPLTRISLGLMTQGPAWRDGLTDTVKGYGALLLGTALASIVLRVSGFDLLVGQASYLQAGILPAYWTTIDVSSLLVVAVGGVAGAALIASNRSVLTAGVMVAVALVPAASLTGIALVVADVPMLITSAARWALEAAIIVGGGLLVFAWKRVRVHRRPTVAR